MKKKVDETKKSVQQMTVIGELGILLAQCDGKLVALNLGTLQKLPNLVQSVKSCDYFAVNARQPVYRLAVATKKKLVLYEYTQSGFQVLRELGIPDAALSMVWHGDTICVGTKNEYTIIDQVRRV